MSNKTSGTYPKSVDPSKWAWFNHDFSSVPERHTPREPKVTVTEARRFNPLLFTLGLILFMAALTPYVWEWVTEGKVPGLLTFVIAAFMILGTLSVMKMPGLDAFRKPMLFLMGAEVILIGFLFFKGQELVALALIGSIVATALGYLAIKSSFAIKERTHTETLTELEKGTRVFGKPGGVADAVGVFGEGNVNAGVAGEKATAELLNLLLRVPGTYVYHGLKFPGSENADVDHAVVSGNRVILIDSKQFRAGDYFWAYNDEGDEFISSQSLGTHYANHMGAAVDGYAKHFASSSVGNVTVSGIVIVHGYGVKITPGGECSKGNIILATPQDAMDILGKHVWDVPPDNRGLLYEMLRWLKK